MPKSNDPEGLRDDARPDTWSRPTNPPTRRPGTFRFGKVFGVEVRVDFSLALVFFLVATSLGNGTIPAWHPDWPSSMVWGVAIGAAVLFFASVLAHELSHAVVARARGMRVSGITLFMFGGATELVGEPPTPGAEFLMAIAGPLTSIAIGVIAMAAGGAFIDVPPQVFSENPKLVLSTVGPVGTLLLWLGPVNIVLGVFNLVPGFPLDGGRVLRSVLWALTHNLERATIWAAGVGELIAWIIITAGVYIAFGGGIPFLGRGLFQGMWLVLIGWFLYSAARMSAARVVEIGILRGVPVRNLMAARVDALDPEQRLDQAVTQTVLRSNQTSFPVLSNGEFMGIIGIRDIQAQRDRWSELRVKDVMVPASRVQFVSADSDASDAVNDLADRDVDQVAVVEGNHFLGVLRREDIVRWLAFHPTDAVAH